MSGEGGRGQGEESLERLLREVSEKLYAGFYIYAALAYAVWIPVLAVFELVIAVAAPLAGESPWGWVIAAAYWFLAGYLVAYSMGRYWRGYVERIAARTGLGGETRSNQCRRASLVVWLLTPLSILLAGLAVETVTGCNCPASWATGVMLGLAPGLFSNVAVEYCSGDRAPASLIAAIGVLVLAPTGYYLGWGGTAFSIIAAYSLTIVAYLFKALKRLA